MADRQKIDKENVKVLFESPFIRVADLQYAPGKHYYNATRRTMEDMVATKSDEEFKTMLPDGVSCIVILEMPGEEARLLLSYEYRYPAGQFLLSVPAGLMDEKDKSEPSPILTTAIREIKEETNLEITEADSITIVNPFVFSSPGMTDESNAMVCAVLHPSDLSVLSQEGAVGSEQFDGFSLLTKASAMEVLRKGRDEAGIYYPLFTWAALVYFVSDMWKQDEFSNSAAIE